MEAAPTQVETAPTQVEPSPTPLAASLTSTTTEPSGATAPVTVDRQPPTFVVPPAVGVAAPASAGAGGLKTAPKPDRATHKSGEPAPPRWWVKYVLWLGTAVVVVIIVAIIRSNSPGSTPNPFGSSISGSSSVHVSNAVLQQFTAISKTLDTANIEATKALSDGNTQSVAQVATEVAPYLTALDTFNFDLHLMTWPTAMQAPSHDLRVRTQSLASFLGSVLSANAASLDSWFTQFHALAQETQVSDNVVRRDIGLPQTTNYP